MTERTLTDALKLVACMLEREDYDSSAGTVRVAADTIAHLTAELEAMRKERDAMNALATELDALSRSQVTGNEYPSDLAQGLGEAWSDAADRIRDALAGVSKSEATEALRPALDVAEQKE